ncbi:MAG: spermidine/putrescine ABC transporter substrate-binding protein [Verrucomicrobiae bacterium]|nr:spermidine/putrescine ABC transporter substrate-binding protein [Verrucomicrobiae bacterium]
MNRISCIVALLVVISLAGCGNEQKEVGMEPSAGKGREIVLFTWDEYFSPELLETFEKETGIRVKLEFYEDTEEMAEEVRVNASAYDVIVADGRTIDLLSDARVLHEIDVPNLVNISREFRKPPYDQVKAYSVPYMWGTTLLAYRKDLIQPSSRSWSLLKDPEVAGKVALLDEKQECFMIGLLLAGKSIDQATPEDLETAQLQLSEIVENGRVKFMSDVDTIENLPKGDEIAVAMMYSGDASRAAAENENVDFFIPDEGASVWMDSFVVSRDTNSLEDAKAFINFMQRPEIAAASSDFVGFATPNKEAWPILDKINPDMRNNKALYPDSEVLERCGSLAVSPKLDAVMNRGWKSLHKSKNVEESISAN